MHAGILKATTVDGGATAADNNSDCRDLFFLLGAHAGIALIRRAIFAVDELVLEVDDVRDGAEFSFSSGSLADDSEGSLCSF